MLKRIISAITGFTLAFSMLGFVPVSAEQTGTDLESVSSSGINDDLTFNSTDSLGELLADKFQEEDLSNNEELYSVWNIEVVGNEITLEYQAENSCTLVAGLFDDEGSAMISNCVTEVESGLGTAKFAFDEMPEYYLIKVFMIETVSLRPLRDASICDDYTQKMQAFNALTTDDFDSEKVINFDEDKSTNFMVFTDDVILLDESDGDIVKNEEAASSDVKIYTFKNASERVKALKKGDIFKSGDLGDMIITKVGSISIDGDTVVITGDTPEIEDVFTHINIDIDTSDAAYTYDDSDLDESLTFVGNDVPESEDDNTNGIETDNQDLNTVIQDENSFGGPLNFTFDGISHKNEDGFTSQFSGFISLGFTLNINYKLSTENVVDYLKTEFKISLRSGITMKLKGQKTLKIGSIDFAPVPGLNIGCESSIVFRGEVSTTISVSFVKSFGKIMRYNTGDEDISIPSNIRFEIEGKFDLYMGFEFAPNVNILCKDVCELKFPLTFGVHCVGADVETLDLYNHSVHTCSNCASFDLYYELNLSVAGKLFDSKSLKFSKSLYNNKLIIGRYYYSCDYDEFGKDICPHRIHCYDITFVDPSGKVVKNATVKMYCRESHLSYEIKTDGDGKIRIYKGTGHYDFNVRSNDHFYEEATLLMNTNRFDYKVELKYDKRYDDQSKEKDDDKPTSPEDDQPTDPKEDDNPPEYLSVVRSKKTLSYKKGNGMKLLEGGNPAGCMGFIDANGTFFVWGLVHPSADNGYGYYSIPNVKKAKMEYFGTAILTKDDNLYLWGQIDTNENWLYYERPKLVAENVKDFCIKDYLRGYAYVTKNGELYVHDKEGTTLKSLRNVRAVYNDSNDSAMACITENDELYMWGDLRYYIPDHNSNNMLKIADNVKDFEFGNLCAYYITNNGDLHSLGIYTEDMPNGENVDLSDQVRMTGIKDVSSTSSYGDRTLILAENGDLYKIGDNSDMYYLKLKDLYPDMKKARYLDNYDIEIILNNGKIITIPVEKRQDNYYRRVKIASNVKSITSLWGNSMYIDKNNDIYIWGYYGSYEHSDYCGIYDRKGQLWETKPATPVKLDDVYASLPAFETETQSANADVETETEDVFTGLIPDSIYNVYGFASDEHNLTNDDLVYIDQFRTNAEGDLPFDTTNVENGDKLFWLAVPMTQTSIKSAEVEIDDLVYNGEEQQVIPKVTLNGNVLTPGLDYYLSGDYLVTDAGEYTITVYGQNLYCGKVSVTFKVAEGSKIVFGDVNNDNKINITDVILVAAHVKGKKLLSGTSIKAADVNKDGKINITDVTKIAAHIKGKKLIS